MIEKKKFWSDLNHDLINDLNQTTLITSSRGHEFYLHVVNW